MATPDRGSSESAAQGTARRPQTASGPPLPRHPRSSLCAADSEPAIPSNGTIASTCRRRAVSCAGGRSGGTQTGAGRDKRCRAPPIPMSDDLELPSQARLVSATRPCLGGPTQDRTRAASSAPPPLENHLLRAARRDVTNRESRALDAAGDEGED